MNAALSFSENKEQIFVMPLSQDPANNHTHQGVSALPDANKAPEVTAKQITPAIVYDRAADVGQVLRSEPPKSDMNYACTSLADTMKETVTGLFGALKSKEPEVSSIDDPQMAMAAPPPRPQAATFGL